MQNFTSSVGEHLDVVSWHTYDFHASDIGVDDHTALKVDKATPRLWNTKYLDLSQRLSQNVTNIAKVNAPNAQVWLSESDSICHQGVSGATNAYLNSVWLVNRLGILANSNVSVMARQSLVGYNYSLLGNWPVEPISPNPDYYTTVLFRRLVGNTVLATDLGSTVTSRSSAASETPAPLRVAAAQFDSVPDVDSNVASMSRLIKDTLADVIAFPETALTSYNASFIRSLSRETVETAVQRLQIACRDARIHCIVGTPWWSNSSKDAPRQNAALFIDSQGHLLGHQPKTMLVGDDLSWAAPGQALHTFPITVGDLTYTTSIIICHDVRFAELVRLPVLTLLATLT